MIVTAAEVIETLRPFRMCGGKVVFTNGCFDLLHVGHVRCLAAAKQCGDVLVVGLNSDESVRRLKGPGRPIVPERWRSEVLDALACVDFVILFDEDTPSRLVADIVPDVLVKGGDYKVEEIAGAKEVIAAGGKVVTIPLTDGISTTGLVECIREANNAVMA